jgi:putative ABC transport system permease protein
MTIPSCAGFLLVLEGFPDPVKDAWFEVIGVAADAQNFGLENPIEPEAWIPYTLTGTGTRGLLVRTAGDPTAMINAVRREIWATDPTVAVADPDTLEHFLNLFTFAQPRFGLQLVVIFAFIGLVLVTIGVYSVTAYSTSRRTHEFGIRMALGAAGSDVLKMVLGKGLQLLRPGSLATSPRCTEAEGAGREWLPILPSREPTALNLLF